MKRKREYQNLLGEHLRIVNILLAPGLFIIERFYCNMMIVCCQSILYSLIFSIDVYGFIGVFVSTTERADMIACGLRTITGLTWDVAFGRRGQMGPWFRKTDNCVRRRECIETPCLFVFVIINFRNGLTSSELLINVMIMSSVITRKRN